MATEASIYDRNVVKLKQTAPILTLVSDTPEYKVLKVLKVWKMASRHGMVGWQGGHRSRNIDR